MSLDSFKESLNHLDTAYGDGAVAQLRGIANNPNFKYSRIFAVGLYTLLEQMNPAITKEAQQRDALLESVSQSLKLPTEKVQRDLEIYRGNLDKFAQAQAALEDILKADRKKKEERAKQKDAVSSTSPES